MTDELTTYVSAVKVPCITTLPVVVSPAKVGESVVFNDCPPAFVSMFVILVLIEPLSVFSPAILAVALVILVLNEPLSVFKSDILAVALVILVENEPLSV